MMTGLSKTRDERQTRQRGIFSSLFDDFLNDRFFSSFENPRMNNRFSIPAANVSEDETCFNISLAVPGMNKEDFDISLDNDLLTIRAEHDNRDYENNSMINYTRQEYNYRSFSRTFTLPDNIDKENLEASYKNGILNIRLCKLENQENDQKTRRIEVK